MAYNKQYYDNQKQEIQQEFIKLVFETYEDVERDVIKKLNKVQEMTKKLQAIELKEKESIEAEKKTPVKESETK
ncbi:hypothetical protein M0R04_13140 [Candidatus Dojkabacteria bacterium]|jgi:hypothetical protein|nr:hypothetical protein [Candidatus Dojkabacteria bacterium]